MEFLHLPVDLHLALVKDRMCFVIKSPFWWIGQNGSPRVFHQLIMDMEESSDVESA